MQAKIDVKDWGNSLPFIQDPGYTIYIFQNIGPQPKRGFDAKAHHNKNAFKALGPEVRLFAEHGLNETKIDAGHSFYANRIALTEHTLTWLITNIGLTVSPTTSLVAPHFPLMLRSSKNNVLKDWTILG